MFHLYGVLIGLGLLSGLWVVAQQAKRFTIHFSLVEDSLFWIALPALFGARLYHVVTDWQLYRSATWFDRISVWQGGLGLFGALIGGMVGIAAFSLTRKPPKAIKGLINQAPTSIFFLLLDLLAFGAPLAQVIGRVGNFINQELYGVPTNLPWGIEINGLWYHPLFAYEALGSVGIFVFVNWLGIAKKFPIGKGQYACVYLTLYGLLRFWLEFLRIESARPTGTFALFTMAQWASLCLSTIALIVFWLRRHANRGIEWELQTLL